MATGFKSGAGGVNPLNFKVVGGTTAPENPRENTVFLHTDVPIDGYTFSATEPQPVSKNSNLLLYPFSQTTSVHNGVTFTDNGDGTITANGKASSDAYFYLINNNKTMAAEGGTYTLTGCPKGGGASTYIVRVYDNLTGSYWEDTGNGRTRELSAGGALDLVCFIRVKSGATVSNLVFRPQFEKGSSATPFTKGDATGQVWISVGNSSSAAFSVTKKNSVMVYPISGYQHIGGSWTLKTTALYRNGAWTPFWDLYAYKQGDEYTYITGGWNGYDYRRINNQQKYNPTVTKGTSNMSVEVGGMWWNSSQGANNWYSGTLFTEKTIDVSAFTKLKINITAISGTADSVWFGVSSDKKDVFTRVAEVNAKNTGTITLDVSSVQQPVYIFLAIYIPTNATKVTFDKIWLE